MPCLSGLEHTENSGIPRSTRPSQPETAPRSTTTPQQNGGVRSDLGPRPCVGCSLSAARQVSIASSVGSPGRAESETGSLPIPPSQTEDLYYGDDQLDHHGEIDEWEHKDQTAKERDSDRPNPCTLSGWELLFEFGVIEPTVRTHALASLATLCALAPLHWPCARATAE